MSAAERRALRWTVTVCETESREELESASYVCDGERVATSQYVANGSQYGRSFVNNLVEQPCRQPETVYLLTPNGLLKRLEFKSFVGKDDTSAAIEQRSPQLEC